MTARCVWFLTATVAVACSKTPATCDAVVEHVAAVTYRDVRRSPERAAELKAAVETCKNPAPPSQDWLNCVAGAPDWKTILACTDAQHPRRALRILAAEAELKVRELCAAAAAALAENRLPPSTGPTPPVGSCCKNGTFSTCAPDPSLWTSTSWAALKFAVDDPHLYSYQITTAGSGSKAAFTVDVFGDLDCNGVHSTFEMQGGFVPNPTLLRGRDEGGVVHEPCKELYRDKELE